MARLCSNYNDFFNFISHFNLDCQKYCKTQTSVRGFCDSRSPMQCTVDPLLFGSDGIEDQGGPRGISRKTNQLLISLFWISTIDFCELFFSKQMEHHQRWLQRQGLLKLRFTLVRMRRLVRLSSFGHCCQSYPCGRRTIPLFFPSLPVLCALNSYRKLGLAGVARLKYSLSLSSNHIS